MRAANLKLLKGCSHQCPPCLSPVMWASMASLYPLKQETMKLTSRMTPLVYLFYPSLGIQGLIIFFHYCVFFRACLALNSNLDVFLTVGFHIFSREVIHCQAGPYELWWPSTLHGFLAGLAPEPVIENIEIRYVRLSFLSMTIWWQSRIKKVYSTVREQWLDAWRVEYERLLFDLGICVCILLGCHFEHVLIFSRLKRQHPIWRSTKLISITHLREQCTSFCTVLVHYSFCLESTAQFYRRMPSAPSEPSARGQGLATKPSWWHGS